MSFPRDHHVVPQFYLRNFAIDNARTKISTLSKEGDIAVWKERSIKSIGFERDFYVHIVGGRPISVETDINRAVENPVSQSKTWAKIVAGRSDELDASDRPILYSLVRHLESRTPHFQQTAKELAAMANDPASLMAFGAAEREWLVHMQNNPEIFKRTFNEIASHSFTNHFDKCLIQLLHSPIPLRASTTPVLPLRAPPHIAMDLPLPGMVPFMRALVIDPFTLVLVVDGKSSGTLLHKNMTEDEALEFNRTVAGWFSKFPKVRHMICGRGRLVDDMTWAPYELIEDSPAKLVFRRQSES